LQRTHLDRSHHRIALLRRPAPATTADGSDLAAARVVAKRAVVVDGHLPTAPFFVIECRPQGSMACFNVSWGIANEVRDRGWQAVTVSASDPIESTCAAAVESAGDRPIVVVVRDACVHGWQNTVIEALVSARPGAVVVVEFGWPGRRPSGAVAYVVAHGAARSSATAVIDRLEAPRSEMKEP
jgi:hypothetical protein